MHLETARMIIRDFVPEDAADLQDIFGDPVTMEQCEPAYDFEKTKRFLESFCIGRNGAVAAVDKQSGKVIGYILFNALSEEVYEMGWFYNRNYWRQGYAYESCKAVIDDAFAQRNVHKIFAETIDAEKSVGMMKKLGVQFEGIQRSQSRDNHGNWADIYLYGMLRKDWENKQNQ